MWEDGISPWSNTPHWAKAKRFVSLDAVDIGEEVLVRVQVECGGEEVNDGEKQEEDTTNRQSNTHSGWHEDGMSARYRHNWVARLEPCSEYAHLIVCKNAWEKWRVRCICLHKSAEEHPQPSSSSSDMAPAQLVRSMVNETTSNSRFQRSRTSIQETGGSRLKKKKTQRCHHQPEGLTADLFEFDFLTEVAESEFRTQPVATGVSATEGQTHLPVRALTHIFLARTSVHSSYSMALFQCGHTAVAQGKRNQCYAFLCAHFHLVCHVLVERSLCPFLSGHVLTYMLFVKTLSVLNLVEGSRVPSCAPAQLKWNVWLLGQSDPRQEWWAQLLQLHERRAHADHHLSHRRSLRFSAFGSIQKQQKNPQFPQCQDL